jgi:cell division protein FtsB
MSLQIIEELAQENKKLLEEIQELKAMIANLKENKSARRS